MVRGRDGCGERDEEVPGFGHGDDNKRTEDCASQGYMTRPRSREQWTLGSDGDDDGGSFGELWSWAVAAGGGGLIPDTAILTASAIYSIYAQ